MRRDGLALIGLRLEAVRMALAGEIVNGQATGGLLAAHAVRTGVAQARPADAPWPTRPSRFLSRRSD